MRYQPFFTAIVGLLTVVTAVPVLEERGHPSKKPSAPSKTCKKLARDIFPRAPPTIQQLEAGAARLAWALGQLGVTNYGLIGGSATALHAHAAGLAPRVTDDFDLIIDISTQPKLDADIVSRGLITDAKTKAYFVAKCEDYVEKPFVKVAGAEIAVEIFDREVWPGRVAYYDLRLPANARATVNVGGTPVSTLNLGWILRQKIVTYLENPKKRVTNMQDIVTLNKLMVSKKLSVTITDAHEIEALKLVISQTGAPVLKGTVHCASIPTLV